MLCDNINHRACMVSACGLTTCCAVRTYRHRQSEVIIRRRGAHDDAAHGHRATNACTSAAACAATTCDVRAINIQALHIRLLPCVQVEMR